MRFCTLIVAFFAILSVCGCTLATSEKSDITGLKRVVEYIKIDDTVIDTGDPYEIIEPVWWTVNIYEDEQAYARSFVPFSTEQRHIFAVIWYIVEVNNGGHEQFYFNSTGIVWKDALEGLQKLDVGEAVDILDESVSRMGGSPSLDRDERQQQLELNQPDFNDLDDRFYKLQDTINLYQIMHQYIEEHREAFYFEGEVEMWVLPNE